MTARSAESRVSEIEAFETARAIVNFEIVYFSFGDNDISVLVITCWSVIVIAAEDNRRLTRRDLE